MTRRGSKPTKKTTPEAAPLPASDNEAMEQEAPVGAQEPQPPVVAMDNGDGTVAPTSDAPADGTGTESANSTSGPLAPGKGVENDHNYCGSDMEVGDKVPEETQGANGPPKEIGDLPPDGSVPEGMVPLVREKELVTYGKLPNFGFHKKNPFWWNKVEAWMASKEGREVCERCPWLVKEYQQRKAAREAAQKQPAKPEGGKQPGKPEAPKAPQVQVPEGAAASGPPVAPVRDGVQGHALIQAYGSARGVSPPKDPRLESAAARAAETQDSGSETLSASSGVREKDPTFWEGVNYGGLPRKQREPPQEEGQPEAGEPAQRRRKKPTRRSSKDLPPLPEPEGPLPASVRELLLPLDVGPEDEPSTSRPTFLVKVVDDRTLLNDLGAVAYQEDKYNLEKAAFANSPGGYYRSVRQRAEAAKAERHLVKKALGYLNVRAIPGMAPPSTYAEGSRARNPDQVPPPNWELLTALYKLVVKPTVTILMAGPFPDQEIFGLKASQGGSPRSHAQYLSLRCPRTGMAYWVAYRDLADALSERFERPDQRVLTISNAGHPLHPFTTSTRSARGINGSLCIMQVYYKLVMEVMGARYFGAHDPQARAYHALATATTVDAVKIHAERWIRMLSPQQQATYDSYARSGVFLDIMGRAVSAYMEEYPVVEEFLRHTGHARLRIVDHNLRPFWVNATRVHGSPNVEQPNNHGWYGYVLSHVRAMIMVSTLTHPDWTEPLDDVPQSTFDPVA